ncbi:hypothetical protein [Variovorax sp. dw_954]|uniref:hypothetical protein n=1 Tax=Variovorax sp. dw_954 TaxID=2720078 RepID=UPI0031F6F438
MNRTPPMQDQTLVDALDNATSLELFQLSMLVERLLTDPRRIVAIRRLLHLGQVVRFYDWKHDQMRTARIVQTKDTQVLLQETETRVQWTLPYAAIEPPAPGQDIEAAPPPPQPQPARPLRADFKRGDKVSFVDRHLHARVGVITRVNQRTASVECEDASSWRVPFHMLRHVMDI